MPFLRSVAVAAIALGAPVVFAHESVTNAQKRAVETFLQAVATGNPQNVAYEIHPSEVEELRTRLMSKLREEAERGESTARIRLFGRALPLADIERLTMHNFYATLARKLQLSARAYDDYQYLGAIPDGGERAQVLVKARLPRVRGIPGTVEVVHVVAIRKYGRDWKAALPSEIEAQLDDLMYGRPPVFAINPVADPEPVASSAASEDSATPAAARERLAAAEKALAESKCDEYYREHMSPNFRRMIAKKALESLISSCEKSIGNREMLLSTLRIVRGLEPRFEYNAQRAVYDVSGQGLPFDRFALELVDRKWYIAE